MVITVCLDVWDTALKVRVCKFITHPCTDKPTPPCYASYVYLQSYRYPPYDE